MYGLESVLCVCTVHISDVPSESVLCVCTVHISDVPSGKCSVSVHSTHFWCTVWKCSVCVHSTHFWCTVWKVFCFCAQYTFLMYRPESVLFLCTMHISDTQQCDISSSILLFRSVPVGFMLFALLPCYFSVVKTVPVPVETCNRSSFPYEFDRYEILGSHLSHKAIWRIQLKSLTKFEVSQRRSGNLAHIRASSQIHNACFAEPSLVKWHHFYFWHQSSRSWNLWT